jgi:hypothetical protein
MQKTTRYWLLLIFFFIGWLLPAQEPLTFTEAIAQKKVLLSAVKGLGGHTGQCISVHFERLTDEPLKLKIPAGHIFEASDTTVQNIITVKDEIFTLTKKKQFVRVHGLCSEAGDSGPMADEVYTVGQSATGNLLKMAQFIAEKRLWDHAEAQYAIWCMSDHLRVAGLSHPGMQQMACQLLGQPLPSYRINYDRSGQRTTVANSTTRRQPVFEKKPLSVEGSFEYQSNQTKKISIFVRNSAGERVRSIFDNQEHLPGYAKYSFFFKTTQLPEGKYEVVLEADGQFVKKITVEY